MRRYKSYEDLVRSLFAEVIDELGVGAEDTSPALGNLEAEIEGLAARVGGLTGRIDALAARRDALASRAQALSSPAKTLDEGLAAVTARLSALQTRVTSLAARTKSAALEEALVELGRSVDTAAKILARLAVARRAAAPQAQGAAGRGVGS